MTPSKRFARKQAAVLSEPIHRLWSIVERLVAAAALTLVVNLAHAVDPAQPIDQLLHTRWGTREGAPSDIREIAQTPDGFLWLGTPAGLVRFDGIEFIRVTARAGEPSLNVFISTLAVDQEGALWVGTTSGHVYRIRHGDTAPPLFPLDRPRTRIRGVVEDADGRLWIADATSVSRLESGRWVEVPFEPVGGRLPDMMSMVGDGRGTVWAASRSMLYAARHGESRFTAIGPVVYPDHLIVDTVGDAWLTDQRGAVRLNGTDSVPSTTFDRMGMHDPNASGTELMAFDHDGGVWSMLDGGVGRLQAPIAWQASANDPTVPQFEHMGAHVAESMTGHLRSMFVDREGDLWVGTTGGLDGFRSTRLKPVTIEGRPIGMAALASAPDGSVWLPGDNESTLRWRNGSVQRLADPEVDCQGPRCGVVAATVDPFGNAWVGGRGTLRRWQGDAVQGVALPDIPAFSPASPAELQAVRVLPDGTLWILASGGLVFRRVGTSWEDMHDRAGLPAHALTHALSLAPDGTVWIGFDNQQLAAVGPHGTRIFGTSDGHHIADPLAILPDAGLTWVGGVGGLEVVRDGHVATVLDRQGAELRGVAGIVRTPSGDLWLHTSAGVLLVPASEVARLLSGKANRLDMTRFDAEDGLDGEAPTMRPLPSAVLSRDGWVWIATTKGVFRIDAAHLERNRVAPTTSVQSVVVDGRPEVLSASVHLPPGTVNLEIAYTAAGLRMPRRLHFRYRLEGFDHDWRDADDRRRAFYTNVPPGSYRFAVQAANEDGLWGGIDRELAIDIAPRYWQTRWFAAMTVLAVVLLFLALHRMRLRRAEQRVRREVETRAHERDRIARELHDTLLQGTTGLVLNLQVAVNELASTDPRRLRLEGLLDTADAVVGEARDRVTQLRARDAEPLDLAAALRRYGEALATRSDGVLFQFEQRGGLPRLAPETDDQLRMIVREALVNAFTHAHARRVSLALLAAPDRLVVTIVDDGVGFDLGAVKNRHWGLVGMRERARAIGARLEIGRAQAGGTEVRVEARIRPDLGWSRRFLAFLH